MHVRDGARSLLLGALGAAALLGLPPAHPARAGTPAPDPRVMPGKYFTLEFPAFGKTWHGQDVGKMQVYIPTDYTPERKFSLFAWFGGGYGSHGAGTPKRITGGKGFVCIGLPYRYQDKKNPTRDAGWATGWHHYKPMLQALEKAVPNIHPHKRIVGGFSSGGAAVATHINRSEEFVQYFRAFTLAGYGEWVRRFGRLKGRPVLLHCGERDSRVKGNRASFPRLKSAGVDVEMLVFKGHGHGVPAEYFPKMLDWMNRKVVYAGLAEAAESLQKSMKAETWTAALKHVQSVLEIADRGMPEAAAARQALEKISARGEAALAELLKEKPSAKALKKFGEEWTPCGCAQQAREKADGLAAGELERIAAMKGWQRTDKLRRFLGAWKGYPVHQKALQAYEEDAAKALAVLKARTVNARVLKDFVDKWSPAPSAGRAMEMLEALAEKDLPRVLETKSPSVKKSRLQSFVRTFQGTRAAAKAGEELRAMREKEAENVLARIKKQHRSAQRAMLRSFLQVYADTKAAEEARRLLRELQGRRR